jgi:hypothetical protein
MGPGRPPKKNNLEHEILPGPLVMPVIENQSSKTVNLILPDLPKEAGIAPIHIPPGTDLLRGYVAPPGDPYDSPKLDTLADEPKMWQEGDPIPPSGIIKSETKVAGMIFADKEGRITKVITKPVFPLITDNEGKVVDVGEELMYPSDYNELLRMAKAGVNNQVAFRKHVENTKLTPPQRSMIYSKLKK